MTDELDKLTEIFLHGSKEEFYTYVKEHPPDTTHDCSSRLHVCCKNCWIACINVSNLFNFMHAHDEKHCKCKECFKIDLEASLFKILTADED
jgi:hypothetical protein